MTHAKAVTQETMRAQAVKKNKPVVAKSPAGKRDDIRRLVHLLEVSQIELEHQNQELRLTERELEISRNKYVNFFDFSPVPFFSVDPSGTIKEVNLLAGRLLGLDRRKLIGRQLTAYIAAEDKTTFGAFLRSVFATGIKQSCTVCATSKEKRAIHAVLEGIKIEDTVESEMRCQIAMIESTSVNIPSKRQ